MQSSSQSLNRTTRRRVSDGHESGYPQPPPLLPLSSRPPHSITLCQRQHQDPQREPDVDGSDPIVWFFRTRASSSDPDPTIETKFSLQRNRRSSWCLSPTIHSEHQPLDPEPALNRNAFWKGKPSLLLW